jgi:hypothetical protein
VTAPFFGSRPRLDPERVADIKGWVQDEFRPGPAATVMVTELRCTEPGCPPLETVIVILDGPGCPRQFKLHKAHADVTRADVARLAAGPGCGHAHEPPTQTEPH